MKTMTQNQIGNRQQNASYSYDTFSIGDKVSMFGWSDINPGTVINTKRGGAEVWVREDKAELAPGERPEFIAVGFAGHCTNQDRLEWNIEEDESGRIHVYTLRKWRGRYCWTRKNSNPDGSQKIALGWRKRHDFNF